ncbi:unnamed protein product [Peronospora farinosa]|uniref:Reverse transcriptase Ty1/copia-type domain-containing protein n=1 Tax=Peronospora farinosa TaxID=134698 RepID=A0AAV0TJ34_9STRA|nr:unnamed protein product [Peronospora farinosa]
MGFEQCRADTCLFVRRNNAKNKPPTYTVLYVGDLLIGCKSNAEADDFKEMSEHFIVKSIGAARFNLGMEVNYSQEKGDLDLNPDKLPSVVKDITSFQNLVSSLLYIANTTQLNIRYAMSVLSQYLDQPRRIHWLRLYAFKTISWKRNQTELRIRDRTTKR